MSVFVIPYVHPSKARHPSVFLQRCFLGLTHRSSVIFGLDGLRGLFLTSWFDLIYMKGKSEGFKDVAGSLDSKKLNLKAVLEI